MCSRGQHKELSGAILQKGLDHRQRSERDGIHTALTLRVEATCEHGNE
jgi:hypothetical protein